MITAESIRPVFGEAPKGLRFENLGSQGRFLGAPGWFMRFSKRQSFGANDGESLHRRRGFFGNVWSDRLSIACEGIRTIGAGLNW
jgi:hypothetical protein